MTTPLVKSTTDELIEELDCYDAGLINDFGGGNVGWWQDYIRAELERAHDHYADQHDALIARIRELEEAQRWVPVSEKLPDERAVVLGWWRDQGPLTVFWDGLHWGDAGDDIAIGYGITHWQPLPEPPQ